MASPNTMQLRRKLGVYCVRCVVRTPELRPIKLMPGETCSRDGYTDKRAALGAKDKGND